MKIGILADIHEHVAYLSRAIDVLQQANVERFITLGDVFDRGQATEETIAMLSAADVRGVWGNHDLGLAHKPDAWIREEFSAPVVDFFTRLSPNMEIDGTLFSHGAPWWDATDPTVFYIGDPLETFQDCFDQFDAQIAMVGHFHSWRIFTPGQTVPYPGTHPVTFAADQRYLIVVNAVKYGWCAMYDTDSRTLTPFQLD